MADIAALKESIRKAKEKVSSGDQQVIEDDGEEIQRKSQRNISGSSKSGKHSY